jgi:hypothetical protein
MKYVNAENSISVTGTTPVLAGMKTAKNYLP